MIRDLNKVGITPEFLSEHPDISEIEEIIATNNITKIQVEFKHPTILTFQELKACALGMNPPGSISYAWNDFQGFSTDPQDPQASQGSAGPQGVSRGSGLATYTTYQGVN